LQLAVKHAEAHHYHQRPGQVGVAEDCAEAYKRQVCSISLIIEQMTAAGGETPALYPQLMWNFID